MKKIRSALRELQSRQMKTQFQFRAINVMLETSKGGHGQELLRGSDA